MSKFKVGDRVRILGGTVDSHRIGDVGIITGNDDDNHPGQTDSARLYTVHTESDDCPYYPREIELIKGEQTMGRRTFRLLKETYHLDKGAVFQEQCDDGDQPYELVSRSFVKADPYVDTRDVVIRDRNLIEDNPKWFEEVFPLVPEYGNKAEVEAFKKFAKGKK